MSQKEKEVKKPEPKEVNTPVRKPGHSDYKPDQASEDKEVKRDQRDGAFGEPQFR